jgi:hypothetical protein
MPDLGSAGRLRVILEKLSGDWRRMPGMRSSTHGVLSLALAAAIAACSPAKQETKGDDGWRQMVLEQSQTIKKLEEENRALRRRCGGAAAAPAAAAVPKPSMPESSSPSPMTEQGVAGAGPTSTPQSSPASVIRKVWGPEVTSYDPTRIVVEGTVVNDGGQALVASAVLRVFDDSGQIAGETTFDIRLLPGQRQEYRHVFVNDSRSGRFTAALDFR